MAKIFRLYLFLTLVSTGFLAAQPRYQIFDFRDPKLKALSVHGQLGLSNYFGDLCPTGDCYTNSKGNFGIGADYRMNDYIFFTLNAQYFRLEGSDQQSGNTGRFKRNLSFRSDNFEISAIGNLEFLNYNTFRYLSRKEFPISMYAFLGVGMTTNNPKALYKGEYVSLRPLQTEGVSYSGVTAVIPFGLGIGYKILDNLAVSVQAGYRYSFSDYLDDVSNTYVDPASLGSQEARDLAFRGGEVGFDGYGAGAKRGNPSSKDGYLLVDFKVSYTLPVTPFLNVSGRQTTKRSRSTISAPSRGVPIRK
jgi:hypothetical protein